jgi:hypothetical protein
VAAQKGDHIPRCNFMFALLTMILLEFACRVCAKDQSGVELGKLTTALNSIEPRYFTPVPGAWGKPRGFVLPGPNPDPHVLWMIWDLVRNGKAHQYQSIIVKLTGGNFDGNFDIDLTGAVYGRKLTGPARTRPAGHLGYRIPSSGDLSLRVYPDQLFLDIKEAIGTSQILSLNPNDAVEAFSRDKNFTAANLETKLSQNGHQRL